MISFLRGRFFERMTMKFGGVCFVLLLCVVCFEAEEDVTPRDPEIELQRTDPMGNLDLFEGDIELKNEEARSAAVKGRIKRWPGGRIYYTIDPSIRHRKRDIKKAMAQIENTTCLRFFESRDSSNRIHIDGLQRCSSELGMTGRVQALHLGIGCESFGTVLHELLHACGLLHEHTRSDRDNYVEILWDNIEEGAKSQFQKEKNGDILLTEFDYDSIMMYKGNAFAKNENLQTIVPLKEGVVLRGSAEKNSMTSKDIEGLRKLYKCR